MSEILKAQKNSNDLMLHLKLLEKQEQAKPKRSRKRKITAKINEIETKKHIKSQRNKKMVL
jgi:hypothetical protein